jgi:hypothetical protein
MTAGRSARSLLGQRGDLERRVGEVDALLGAQLGAARPGMGDLDPDALTVVLLDEPADLAVVEPDTVPVGNLLERRFEDTLDPNR